MASPDDSRVLTPRIVCSTRGEVLIFPSQESEETRRVCTLDWEQIPLGWN